MTWPLNTQSGIIMWVMLLTTTASDICQQCTCSGNRMDCSSRGLSAVPNFFPKHTMWLDLSRNKITSIGPEAFLSVPNLMHLDISRNLIESLNDSAFIGLSELLYLNLDKNPVQYASGFSDDVFLPLVKLKELYLLADDCPQHPPDKYLNRLATLDTLALVLSVGGRLGDTLGSLRRLHTLILTSGRCVIPKLNESDMQSIAHLPLRRLSLRNAGLVEISPTVIRLFNRTLQKLDLSCNQLTNLPVIVKALRGSMIDTLLLDASVESFVSVKLDSAFFEALGFTPLKILSVERNMYLEVDFSEHVPLNGMPNIRYLRAGYNQLIIHPRNSLPLTLIAVLRLLFNLRVLDISNLFNLLSTPTSRYNQKFCVENDRLFTHDEKQPWEDDVLRYPPLKSFWIWLLNTVYHLKILSKWTLPPVLTRLYASNLGIAFEKFNCEDRQIYFKNNLKILNLDGASVESIQCNDSGLSAVTDISFTQSKLRSFDPALASSRSMPLLNSVDLSGNALGHFFESRRSDGIFNNMKSLRSLDLSSNGILNLQNDFVVNLGNITHINVSHNSLSTWNATIISLDKLVVLDISSNQIANLTKKLMEDFDAHSDKVTNFVVNLSSNPIPCSCDNANFLLWLNNTKVVHHVTSCLDGSTARPLGAQLLRDLEWRCTGVPVLIIVLSVSAVLLVAAILSYGCRWRLRYLYYKCKRMHQCKTSTWRTDEIGVYVSYHESNNGAAKRFCAYLESQVGVGRVVTRHSAAVGHYELEQIAVFIDECDVTVMLISPESLSDSKAEFELYMALEKGMHCVLPIIMTESLKLARLPRALRKLLMINCYLRLPSSLSDRSAHEEVSNSGWQCFFLVFESWLLNIIERQTSRVLRNDVSRAGQQPDAIGGDVEPLVVG